MFHLHSHFHFIFHLFLVYLDVDNNTCKLIIALITLLLPDEARWISGEILYLF